MSIYADFADTARDLLAEFGAACALTRQGQGQGQYNPSTGTYDQAPAETQDAVAAVFPYPQKLIDGTTVMQGDQQAYVAPGLDWAPRATDVLTWQGVDYTVVSVKNLAPAGESVLFELQVRS